MGLNKVLTFIGDVLFSLFALFVIFYFAQKANYLELRFYLFAGALLGLIIYLHFFSNTSKKLFKELLKIIICTKNLIVGTIIMFFQGVAHSLILMMRIPYGVLKWFSMLIFRIGEALGKESVTIVKGRMTKHPKE